MSDKKGVLFVCGANRCRSPIAEAVFGQLLKERGLAEQFFADSSATGDSAIGETPDERALKTLREHHIDYDHVARQITDEDFYKYDYIFGMDHEIIDSIKMVAPEDGKAVIELLGKYDPQKQTVIEDPNKEQSENGFQRSYEQCLRACKSFLDQQNMSNHDNFVNVKQMINFFEFKP